MKDKMNLALVNFSTAWGDKKANLANMEGYISAEIGRAHV